MPRFLRKGAIAVLVASIFVVTTLIGWIAAFIGALIYTQLPDSAMPETTSQDESGETASAIGRYPLTEVR
jgi:hypothetical protein